MQKTRYPNLFIVGAPKCGTTSLAYYLAQHPEIYAPTIKESGFYSTDLNKKSQNLNKDDYLKLYGQWKHEKYAFDATTDYFLSLCAASSIFRDMPSAKIIVMVRNPIDAAYSMYWQNRFSLREDAGTFELALEAEHARLSKNLAPDIGSLEHLLYTSIFDYKKNITKFLNVFEQSQIHLIVFDDFVTSTDREVRKVFEFLRVSQSHPIKFDKKNPSTAPKSLRAGRFLQRPPYIIQKIAQAIVPHQFRMRMRTALMNEWNAVEYKYPPLAYATRKELALAFAPSILWLAEYLHRDLSHWLEIEDEPNARRK